jgi:hypothetical protein
MENDEQRFNAEVGEAAHYWFVVSDFTQLIEQYGMEKVLTDVIQLRDRTKKQTITVNAVDCPFNSSGC